MIKLFVDMDGVLADFHTGYKQQIDPNHAYLEHTEDIDWKAVRTTTNFFLNLPPMPGHIWFWNQIRYLEPTIITGLPDNVPEALANKKAWVEKHLGDVPVIGCRSRDKCLHGNPGDVLIDDWEKYKHKWIEMGGHWITFKGVAQAINELRDHLLQKQMDVKF